MESSQTINSGHGWGGEGDVRNRELKGDLHCLFYLLLYYLTWGLQGNCVDFVIFFLLK